MVILETIFMNWPVMSHQQHGGYESMAREKCPCPTVVARAVLLYCEQNRLSSGACQCGMKLGR